MSKLTPFNVMCHEVWSRSKFHIEFLYFSCFRQNCQFYFHHYALHIYSQHTILFKIILLKDGYCCIVCSCSCIVHIHSCQFIAHARVKQIAYEQKKWCTHQIYYLIRDIFPSCHLSLFLNIVINIVSWTFIVILPYREFLILLHP